MGWGSFNQSGSGNRGWCGVFVSVESETSSSITFRVRTYFASMWSAYGTGSYTAGGSSGSFSYSHPLTLSSRPSTGSSNATLVNSRTATYSKDYGSSRTITFSGSISGISAIPGTMTASGSGTVPARAFNKPSAPTNVSVTRNSDSSHTLSASVPASTSAPSTRRRWQRRVYSAPNGWSKWTTRQTFTGSRSSTYTTTWTDRGTRDNRVYQWRLVSENSAGSATSSSSGSVWTTPYRPGDVSAQSTANGIRVRFRDAVRFGSHEHEIQHGPDGAVPGGAGWSRVALIPGAVSHYDSLRSWTLTDPDVSVTHRFAVRSRTTSGPLLVSDWVYTDTVELAAPPNKPTITGPSRPVDVDEQVTVTYAHAPSDGSEQQRRQLRWRFPGESWNELTVNSTADEFYVVGSGATPIPWQGEPGMVDMQVRTWGAHPDPSPWSDSFQLLLVEKPTVSINAPVEGDLVETSTVTVEWGYAQGEDEESESPQAAWRVTVLADGVEVQSHSGTGDDSALQIRNLDDATEYTIRVQVRSAHGLWSEVEEVSFTVEYPLPVAPEITDVVWDVERGAAAIEILQPKGDGAEPEYHLLWRQVDDGPWRLIEADIPVAEEAGEGDEQATVGTSDPIPVIGDGTVNRYQATTVSVLPSVAHSEVVELAVPSTGRDSTQGWVYLNAGPSMLDMVRIRANATRSGSKGRTRELRQFAGRTLPVPYSGDARSNTWDIDARVAPNFDDASTLEELIAFQEEHNIVCYRDPLGARWFASMGPVSDSWRSIVGEVSWSMTEVDFTDGLATADVVVSTPGEGEGDDE